MPPGSLRLARHVTTLGHAEPVARVVAQRRLDPVRALARLREELHTALAELLKRAAPVVGAQNARTQRALADELLDLCARVRVHHRRTGLEPGSTRDRPARAAR